MRARKVVVVSGLGVAILIILALLVGPRTLLNEVQTALWPHQFSQAAWAEHPDQRYHMALDLEESGSLQAMTRTQLIEALGEPLDEDPYSDPMTGDGSGTLLSWDVSSPQRPGDRLYVFVDSRGGVSGWGVTHDVESVRLYP